jgi:crotonobetaine/carnitine-CoA ligase
VQINGHDLEVATIKDLVRSRAVLGDKPLAYVEDECLTYAAADEGANRIANSLAALGIGKGDVVATFMYNSVDHILVWFACAKLGAVWAPLNVALAKQDLAYTLGDTRARALVVDYELYPAFAEIRRQLMDQGLAEIVRRPPLGMDVTALDDLKSGSPVEPAVTVEPSDPAGLIYTGGTTGLPKGVKVSNFWYFPGVFRYQEILETTPGDVHLGLGQMCHTIGSAVDILAPVYWQMTTVTSRWFSVSRFWDTVHKHRCTVSVMLGTLMVRLLSAPPTPDDTRNSLRRAVSVTGGFPRDAIEEFARRFDIPLLETYGQTEMGPLGCISQRMREMPRISQGSPHGWADLMIARPDGTTCTVGETGEILLRPTVPGSFMLGYVNQPEKFQEACRDLWFHSGDLGYVDELGDLHFSGRMAHTIRHKGENISAIEVEEVLREHPAVANCGVVGLAADTGEDDIKAFVQLHEDHSLSELELVQFCAERLAFFKVPRYVEFVATLPLSVTKGDVERHKLHAQGRGNAWDREAAGYDPRRKS